MNTELKNAVDIICDELTRNPDYFYAWQSNIAVAFQDEYANWVAANDGNRRHISSSHIHSISNEAAKRFLRILMANSEQKAQVSDTTEAQSGDGRW